MIELITFVPHLHMLI